MALDISKTFDRVWHAALLHKLKSYGISGQIFGLIPSFLGNRRFQSAPDGKSSQKYPVNDGVPFLVLNFSCITLMTFLTMLSVILLSTLMILLSMLYTDQAPDLWQQLELASELESDLRDTVDWGKKWLVDFNAGKTQLVSFGRSNNNGSIDVDWGSYIISIAKTASKEIVALIHSMKFFSPEVALYLYKSTIRPYMEYCCHVWVGAPSCYLELLDKLQKRICRTVGPLLAASLEHLAHRNVASFSLFYGYYFGRCSSELAQLVPLPFSRGRSPRYSDKLRNSPFLDATRMSMSAVSFLALLNSGILCL